MWSGQVCVPDVGNLPVHISYTGGMGDLAAMLSNQPIDVKGTVRGTIQVQCFHSVVCR